MSVLDKTLLFLVMAARVSTIFRARMLSTCFSNDHQPISYLCKTGGASLLKVASTIVSYWPGKPVDSRRIHMSKGKMARASQMHPASKRTLL